MWPASERAVCVDKMDVHSRIAMCEDALVPLRIEAQDIDRLMLQHALQTNRFMFFVAMDRIILWPVNDVPNQAVSNARKAKDVGLTRCHTAPLRDCDQRIFEFSDAAGCQRVFLPLRLLRIHQQSCLVRKTPINLGLRIDNRSNKRQQIKKKQKIHNFRKRSKLYDMAACCRGARDQCCYYRAKTSETWR